MSQELLLKAQALYTQAIEMTTKENASAEDLETARRMMTDADGIKARVALLDELHTKHQAVNPLTHQAPASNEGFKDFKDFIGAVSRSILSKGHDKDARFKFQEKDLSGATGASGGFLIPEQTMTEIMGVSAPMNVIRQGASVIQMNTREVTIPKLDQTNTSASLNNFFGGINVEWVEENSTMPTSDPVFMNAILRAFDAVGTTIVSNSLLQDVSGLASYLGSSLGFPGAIAAAEEGAFLNGDGVGKPQGIVASTATIATTRTSAGNLRYDDLANMMGRFYGSQPVWVATIPAMAQLLLMNGPTGNASYLWGNATTGVPNTLLGYPIFFTDKLPAVGTRGDVMLIDRKYYLVGNRLNATTIEASEHIGFAKNQTQFRIVHRVGGQPWLNTPITLLGATQTVSPFVAIAT